MDPDVQKARDELLYEQVKGTRSLSLGLAIVFGACTVATIAFAVGILVLDKGISALITDAGMMLASAGTAYAWWTRYKQSAAALDEIGDDPTGIDTCKTYSASTAEVIALSRKTKKELFQLWIAYGLLALTLLLFGGLFVVFLLTSFKGELLFAFCGALLLAGGVVLLSMAIGAFREWLVACRLEELEGPEETEEPRGPEGPEESEEPEGSKEREGPEGPEEPEGSEESEEPEGLT